MKKVPVLILAFNRPDHVIRAVEAVRTYQPNSLYLSCDGPRENKDGEAELIMATQRAMLDAVDWECEIKTLFREKNLGCAQAVYEAITWFFNHEEYGVIIEDDMVIGLDFFRLCEDLLPRYNDKEEIMCINAQNHSCRTDIANSYVYSYRSSCWGWASWARAWKKMDMTMSYLQNVSLKYLTNRLGFFEGIMMMHYFRVGYKHIDTFKSWAYRWCLSIHANDGLVIVPGVNLAKNIGTDGGVHFKKGDVDLYADLPIGNLEWPLEYNDTFIIDCQQSKYDADDFLMQRKYGLRKKLRKLLHL